jgi:hypothetical protein
LKTGAAMIDFIFTLLVDFDKWRSGLHKAFSDRVGGYLVNEESISEDVLSD